MNFALKCKARSFPLALSAYGALIPQAGEAA